jgi:hypothetical protein
MGVLSYGEKSAEWNLERRLLKRSNCAKKSRDLKTIVRSFRGFAAAAPDDVRLFF